MAQNPPTTHHGHAWVLLIASPWLLFPLGGIVLVMWYLATQFSMNTSEALFINWAFGQTVTSASAVAHFSIPQQFLDLLYGNGTAAQLMTEGYGFFLEVLNLVFAIGISYALQVVQKGSGALVPTTAKEAIIRHRVFLGFLIGLLCFDIYSSATYGGASTIGSILFAALLQFVAFFFLPLGIMFLRAGWMVRK